MTPSCLHLREKSKRLPQYWYLKTKPEMSQCKYLFSSGEGRRRGEKQTLVNETQSAVSGKMDVDSST
jgi:hypothetical protein